MRTILGALILAATLALNAVMAVAASSERTFVGDGFDGTTCADLPRGEACR